MVRSSFVVVMYALCVLCLRCVCVFGVMFKRCLCALIVIFCVMMYCLRWFVWIVVCFFVYVCFVCDVWCDAVWRVFVRVCVCVWL